MGAAWGRKAMLAAGLWAALAGPAEAGLPVYRLTAVDGRFTPTLLSVPAGQKIKLLVHNQGPAPEEFESSDLNQEQVVVPGATITLFVGPLEPGSYAFFGDFHPTTARGRIVVK